jgi:hypothetical protein
MRTRTVFQGGTHADAVAHFVHAGWVHVRPADGAALTRRLQAWADEVAALAGASPAGDRVTVSLIDDLQGRPVR